MSAEPLRLSEAELTVLRAIDDEPGSNIGGLVITQSEFNQIAHQLELRGLVGVRGGRFVLAETGAEHL